VFADVVRVTRSAAALMKGAGFSLEAQHPLQDLAATLLPGGAAQVEQLVHPPDHRHRRAGDSVPAGLAHHLADEAPDGGVVIRRGAA
jgi:hypothetical protein